MTVAGFAKVGIVEVLFHLFRDVIILRIIHSAPYVHFLQQCY